MGYITVIARVAMDLWQRKPTLSSGYALGLGRFTAINPGSRAITITYIPLLPGPPPPNFLQLLILPPQGRMSRLNPAFMKCWV